MKHILAVLAFLLLPLVAMAANPSAVISFPSIAAMKALGAAAPFYPAFTVQSWHAGVNDGGGGNFTYQATCDQATPDEGTHYAIISGPTNSCEKRDIAPNEPWSVQWWGAYGNAQQLKNCAITTATVSCTGHAFVNADVTGPTKLAGFYLAGGSTAGMRNATLITTTSSIGAGNNLVLAASATNNVASGGIFAWGTDDTTAINTACKNTPPGQVLKFPQPGYMLSGTFTYGNNNASYCHNLLFPSNQLIVCLIPNNTSDCMDRHAGVDGSGAYIPMNLNGSVTIDAMNTGKWPLADLGGENIFQDTVAIDRGYWEDWARAPTGSDFVQQLTAFNTSLFAAGVSCVLNWANAASPSAGGYIDEVNETSKECAGFSQNAMGLAGQAVVGITHPNGIVRIQVGSTAVFTSGHPITGVNINGSNVAEANGINPGTVVDSTHVDLAYAVTGAVAGPGGVCQLTLAVNQTSIGMPPGLVSGNSYTTVGISGATGCNGTQVATLVAGTNLAPGYVVVNLTGTTFGGSYTSGGQIGITYATAFTSGGMIAPSEQLGTCEYSINTGSGTDNFIEGHTEGGAKECDNGRTTALSFGSDVAPDAYFWGDGTLPHVLYGSNAMAMTSAYSRWSFDYPQVEGESGTLPGAYFGMETVGPTPTAFLGYLKGSNYTLLHRNISTGSNCGSSANGCGNHFIGVGLPGNVAQDDTGAPLTVGGALQAAGVTSTAAVSSALSLTYSTTLKSTQALISVTATDATDLTAFLGNTHGIVEVSGEDGAGNNFDDLVAWEYSGAAHAISTSNVIGSPGARTYAIDGSTHNLEVTIAGSGTFNVRVFAFGGL